MESRHTDIDYAKEELDRMVEEVLITEPKIITNADKRIVRVIPSQVDDQWHMIEVLTRESGNFGWETKTMRLSDREWADVNSVLGGIIGRRLNKNCYPPR